MTAVEVIRTKRDGGRLSDEQINWFITEYTRGGIPDEQASALLMSIVWRGMDAHEIAAWTAAMIASGETLDLSGIDRPTADKHSTGGVGDKVSLILGPLAAACGLAVPMLSGRGLGHTGGTLDKLETIPGYRVDLSPAEMIDVVRKVGCVICAAGPGLAPADRKLYALRDVTATVESIPLIASSIMSKKVAEGTKALVLDVKVGSGAFFDNIAEARRLAETMVGLGDAHGVRTSALLTAMDTPLGTAVGNALEVEESVEALMGKGSEDLMEVTFALCREMLHLTGVDAEPEAAIQSGAALEVFRAMVHAQRGDPDAPLPQARHRRTIDASSSGRIVRLDARAVGVAAWRLGAGRTRKEDAISAGAGVVCLKKPGAEVAQGEPLLELRTDDPARWDAAIDALEGSFEIGLEPPLETPLILERVGP